MNKLGLEFVFRICYLRGHIFWHQPGKMRPTGAKIVSINIGKNRVNV